MRFENEFAVDAPVDTVWAAVLDVEKVAPTVPGAKVLEKTSDTNYKVGIKVKLGPMTMQYKGDVEIVEADESSHRAVMKARAKESRGQGTADADVTMELSGDATRTTGTIITEMKVSGKAASMGRGVMQDVAGRMVGTFAENLAKMLEGGEEATDGDAPAKEARPGTPEGEAPREEPETDTLDIGSLGASMALDRVKDPLVIGLLLLAFLLGRRSAR
ncbi:MAG TPA: SRPBCC family protein [Solirubrobacteraceae bacterium]|jgi:carbon monoxide dehydrogenase subunit G